MSLIERAILQNMPPNGQCDSHFWGIGGGPRSAGTFGFFKVYSVHSPTDQQAKIADADR